MRVLTSSDQQLEVRMLLASSKSLEGGASKVEIFFRDAQEAAHFERYLAVTYGFMEGPQDAKTLPDWAQYEARKWQEGPVEKEIEVARSQREDGMKPGIRRVYRQFFSLLNMEINTAWEWIAEKRYEDARKKLHHIMSVLTEQRDSMKGGKEED
jgi:hypothetical protein